MSFDRGGKGGYLVRCELLDGTTKWRNLPDLEHKTLCRAFGLSETCTWFDLPSTARTAGSMQQGYGLKSAGHISGFIFQGPKGSDPIGKLTMCREGEKFPDRDPNDKSDFFKLD